MSAADFSAMLIALREGVEMTLIVGIVLAYLTQIGARRAQRWVWMGVAAAAAVSFGVLGLLNALDAEFKGATEQIFEGSALLLAAAFLTWMIFWMLQRARYMKAELQSGVRDALGRRGASLGLFALAFFTVLREGVETALLLFAAPGEGKLLGTLVGFAGAIAIGVLIYVYGRRINLNTFFRLTGALLIVFAAGLVMHGVHEFVEAGVLPGGPGVWDLGDVLPDREGVGSVLRALLGYSDNASLSEVVAYVAYYFLAQILSRTRIIGREAPRAAEARSA
ncbi:MAG: FTR1 family iron permease [Chloroflexota bacterium]|nr:FTR1 family iron permease [Chloroflexota bacterium]